MYLIHAFIAFLSLTKFLYVFRYVTSVIPIGATFAMTLWLGNTAYLYISVAFAQMLKAISELFRSCFLILSLALHVESVWETCICFSFISKTLILFFYWKFLLFSGLHQF